MKRTFAVIGFSFGVTLFLLNVFGAVAAKYAAVATAALFLVTAVAPALRRKRELPVIAGTALFACMMYLYAYDTVALPQLSLGGRTTDAVLYLTSLSEKTASGGYSYTAKIVSASLPNAQGIKIRLFSHEQITAAGYQMMECKLKFLPTVENGFSSYGLWGKGIFTSAQLKFYTVTSEHITSPMRWILEMRYAVIHRFENHVGGDAGALSAGLLVGDRSQMSPELRDAFKIAGASHLTAVSGLHLSAVSGFFAYIFRACGVKNKISSPVLLGIILFYCALSGFSKSVVRAGIMLAVVLIGAMLKKHADTLNSLGFALFVICVNPFAVCDISTLLTVCSMLAIIKVYPVLEQRRLADAQFTKLRRGSALSKIMVRIWRYVVEMLLLSASITLSCLPITCVFFGYFSVVGVFLNVILVPLGTLAVSLSLVGSYLMWVPLMPLAVRGVNLLIIKLIYLAARAPFAVFHAGEGFYILLAVLLCLVGGCAVFSPQYMRKVLLFALTMITGAVIILSAYDYTCAHIFVTESGAAAICTKEETIVLATDSKTDFYELDSLLIGRSYHVDRIYTSAPETAQTFAEKYHCTEICAEQECYNYEIGGVTFAVGDNSRGNIILVENRVYDANGEHALAENGRLYSVRDGSYSVVSY
ncbi:MAG: ComEC/Rec2 family competence protein [Ruminococcaceae bacterium]|nr:ComEC/Rec2 family competence protein [Oscillospiraceae bacterium]